MYSPDAEVRGSSVEVEEDPLEVLNQLLGPDAIQVQGDDSNMAVCFWYLVKSYFFRVHLYSSIKWASNFLQGTRKNTVSLVTLIPWFFAIWVLEGVQVVFPGPWL